MNLIDIPLIIAVAAMTDCIIFGTLYHHYVHRKFGHLIGMAKNYASILGEKSGESRRGAKNKILVKGAKEKVINGMIEQLPLGGLLKKIMEDKGVSAEEIFALIQDEDFMKGVKAILGMFGAVADKITGHDSVAKPAVNELPYMG